MTNRIDELMREVWQMRLAVNPEAQAKRVKEALEAALKPGEPVDWKLKDGEASEHYGKDIYVYYGRADFSDGINPCDFSDGLIPLYTSPTAQTPTPRLTDAFIEEAHWGEMCNRDLSFARAIENAVRKQFGVQE